MIKQFFKYLLSKSMKQTYSITFALLLLCLTVASASAFTMMAGDIIVGGQNMIFSPEKDFSQPWNILGTDITSDDLTSDVVIPNVIVSVSKRPELKSEDIFESYFNDIDKIILKRNQLQAQYENLKQDSYDVRSGKSYFSACDLKKSVNFVKDRTAELTEQTTSLKYKVWGMKANPGTTELETKAVVMKKLNAEEYRTKQLDNQFASLQTAVNIACDKESETLVIPEEPVEEPEDETEEPEVPSILQPDPSVSDLEFYNSRYIFFNHVYNAFEIYYNYYVTALENNDFNEVCKSDASLEELVSKSKELRVVTKLLVQKVAAIEPSDANEMAVKNSLLEKAKALYYKSSKLSVDIHFLGEKYPENYCDVTNPDGNDNSDGNDNGNDNGNNDNNDDGNNNQNNGVDVTQEQELFDYLAEALTVLTTSFDETKTNITDMYCNGQETEANNEKNSETVSFGMTYVFFHGAAASTQSSLTEKGADELASQFGQLVTDYEVFGMNVAEFGNSVFTQDVCAVADGTDDGTGDNQTNDNNQNNNDEKSDADKLSDFENQFDAFDEEYDNLRDDLETAEDDEDEDEIDDIKDDLKDLYDDVDELYDELTQFKGVVPENLKDDVSDLKEDVKALKAKIKCLIDEDSSSCDNANDNSDLSDDSYEYTPSSTTTTNNNKQTTTTKKVEEVDLITTSVQPTQASTSGTVNTAEDNDVVKFTESSTYFAMLISGFILLLGVAVFLGAVVVRLY